MPGVPLKRFTPQQNPAAARISGTYQWPGHYLKYERPEGEIDFLSVVLQTEPGYAWMDHGAGRIPVETPEEILVKKIRFRSPASRPATCSIWPPRRGRGPLSRR